MTEICNSYIRAIILVVIVSATVDDMKLVVVTAGRLQAGIFVSD